MRKTNIRRTLFLFFILLLACKQETTDWRYSLHWPYSKERPNWPTYVIISLWIPHGGQDIRYYTRPESYQVTCDVNICFPAESVIDEMVSDMKAKGWMRFIFDFLNPGLVQNHARPYKWLAQKWEYYLTQDDTTVHTWIDDWLDSKGNIVRYVLMYRTKNGATITPCDLHVTAIYKAAETLPKR